MKKIVKKLLTSVLAIALVVAVAPVSKVEAAGETWINNGDGWHYLQGTDIKVKMADNMIRISGSGELPDFDYWELYKRPWDKTSFEYVTIDDTITSIGKYAFYGKNCAILTAHRLKAGEMAVLPLKCADGQILSIDSLQPDGKKPMDAKSFINGYKK